MGRPAGWMTTRTGRPAMRSPGRPPVRRDVERAFWLGIASGLTSEDVEFATMAWVDRYNHRRLHSTLAMITPAEHEAAHYAATTALQPERQPV